MNPSSHAGVVNSRRAVTAPVRRLPTKRRQPHQTHRRWTFTGADFAADTGAAAVGSARDERVAPVGPEPYRLRVRTRWSDSATWSACDPAVERESGRLKMGYGLMPIRVRGIAGVALHADLVMLARLNQALARARAVRLAA